MSNHSLSLNQTSGFTPLANAEAQVHFTAYVIVMVIAIPANIVTIFSFIIDRTLCTNFNLFLLNMAFIDLLTSLFRIGFNAFCIATIRNSTWPYGQPLCDFDGFIQGVVFAANVYTLMVIAVCRYIAIVHSKQHLITKKVVYIIIVIIWAFSSLCSVFPIIGWNRYRYQPYEHACLPDWSYEKSYPIYIMATEFVLPMIILLYCYTGIFINLRRNSFRMRTVSELNSGNNEAMKKIAQREGKVTRGMFIIFLAFVICFAPYSVCMFLLASAFNIPIDKGLMFFCGFMANVNSLLNPIIYAILYKRFRQAYYRVLCCCCSKLTFSSSSDHAGCSSNHGLRSLAMGATENKKANHSTSPSMKTSNYGSKKYRRRFSFIYNEEDINNR
ncbi:Rhodopsin, GQ-coupled [Trichoplax sp. H2]|nr:Rhodopsin, GQ-coupled [Trichoplax sp. H2]|eukprot:RDD38776.1 Rhodopsin, GQ-coupled [Trichoplax sp. H2]